MKKTILFVILFALMALVSCSRVATEMVTPTEVTQIPEVEFNVAFDSNGGEGSMKTLIAKGQIEAPACNFTGPEGFIFTSWNTNADGTGIAYTKGMTIVAAHDVTLYAQWQPSTYAIILGEPEVNGGKVTSSAQIYHISELDQISTLRLDEVYPGYSFVGFGNDENNKVKGFPEVSLITIPETDTAVIRIPVGVTGDVTIVPEFRAHTYEVLYEANGGTGEVGNTDLTYGIDGTIASNGFTKDLHTFRGWNTEADGTGVSYTEGEVVKNLTTEDKGVINLYAQWTPYAVLTYVANNGTTDTITQQVACGEDNLLVKNTFAKSGFNFSGWTTAVDGSVEYADEDTINTTEDVTLYASWAPVDYQIVVADVEHGKVSVDRDTYNISESYQTIGFVIEADEGYKVTDYKVTGAENIIATTKAMVIPAQTTGDLSVIPVFTEVEYKVVYDKNAEDATGSMDDTSHIYSVAQNISPVEFSRIGYLFDSWNTEADGTGARIEDAEEVVGLTEGNMITLYAQWEALVPFTINSATIFEDCEVLEDYYTYAPKLDRKYIIVADGEVYDSQNNVITDDLEIPASSVKNPYSAYNGGEGFDLEDSLSFYKRENTTVTIIYMHSPVWVVKTF